MSDIESDLESPARKKRPSAVAITPPPPSPGTNENEIEQKRAGMGDTIGIGIVDRYFGL